MDDSVHFCGKTDEKPFGKAGKKPVFRLKTSDFLGTNIRTFEAKPRNFMCKMSDVSVFPPENRRKYRGKAAKMPNASFWRYFGARFSLLGFEALLGPLSAGFQTPFPAFAQAFLKIAHSLSPIRHEKSLSHSFPTSPSALCRCQPHGKPDAARRVRARRKTIPCRAGVRGR